MSRLHLFEYPESVSLAQLEAAFSCLGVPPSVRCRRMELTLDGFTMEVVGTDLSGRADPSFVTIHVPVRPGST